MIVSSFLILTGTFFKIIEAYNRPNHFGNPCVLCKCFVEYTDRDLPITLKPYGVAIDGYSTTEDQCLATCLKDSRCKAAVYGLIGGRDVFTCELYETTTVNQLIYVPNVNIYLPKRKSGCKVYYDHIQSSKLTDRQEEITKRKDCIKTEKVMQQFLAQFFRRQNDFRNNQTVKSVQHNSRRLDNPQ